MSYTLVKRQKLWYDTNRKGFHEMPASFCERAFAQIDTDALAHNFRAIATLGGRTVAVVKANAYGHGAHIVVPALAASGCDFFAVATLDEALQVRALSPRADILILGYTPPREAPLLAREHLTQTVFSASYAAALSGAADTPVLAHLKIDCGMHRLGLSPTDSAGIASVLHAPKLHLCGIFTHLPSVTCDPAHTQRALAAFSALTRTLPHTFAHAAASAALSLDGARFDGTRPGLALYGLADTLPSLRPAMRVYAPIVQIHALPAGEPVGYDGAFCTTRPSRIGVLPIGYADGLPRAASGHRVLLKSGETAPLVGHICMDQCMVDLTQTSAKEGDTVCVIPDFAAFATHCGTIVYETLACLSTRVGRRQKGECHDRIS